MTEPEVYERFIQFVDGFPLPSQGFIPEVFRQVLRMRFQPGDIILSTFPKCGTTWTQYIIWGLLNDGAIPPSVNQVMFKEFPFLELVGPQPFENLTGTRMAKVHLPYNMTPKGEGARFVHVLRNPFDTCVSLYWHLVEIDAGILGVDLPFDQVFDAFLKGTTTFGDYFQHEITWFDHRNDAGVLFLTFESMKEDPRGAVLQIAEFLGHGDRLRRDPGLVDNVLKHSSFQYLKDNCQFRISKDAEALARMGEDYATFVMDDKTSKDDTLFRSVNFFRKGQVGSSREQLSDDQWQRLEAEIQKKVADPELKKLMLRTRQK